MFSQSTAPLDPLVGTWTKHGTTAVHHHLLDACPTEDLFHGESKGTWPFFFSLRCER